MQVNIVAHADMKQAQAQFTALTAQIDKMNAAMERSAMMPAGGSPAGFQAQQRALKGATVAYNNALASSGKYHVQQLKLNDAVDQHVQLLQKQKLAFRDVFGKGSKKMMDQVYKQQLAMKHMVAQTATGTITDGRMNASMAIPTSVMKSWDTFSNRVGFASARLASASTALQNWGKNTQWAGRQLTAGLSMPIAAFGAAAGVMAYQVNKQMTRIQKVYDTTANAQSTSAKDQAAVTKELMNLQVDAMNTAKNAAQEYGASITDTLNVQAELAATGLRGQALQKSTTEVMRIATLGEMDQAKTTQALIALQQTLGLTAAQTGDAFNYMNNIENSTSLQMEDFATAIPKALAPMKQMGGSLKDLGTLLVAMKERGIGAAEGANAIKAMMQRLYRPSKQIREEWEKLTGIDPMQIVKEEGGSIMKILPRIAKAVDGLGRADKVKALSGLFGTYQVTRMNAMLEGIDNMGDKTTQTYKAIEIAGKSAADNAKVAQMEMDRYVNSGAGKFQRALQSFKAELADIGEPFLAVASVFLSAITKIGKAFNAMPGWAKKGIALTAILVALAGPVIMLVGLFANFAGSIGKLVASAGKFLTSFELVTKSQYGAQIAAKLARREFDSEANSLKILTGQMEALNVATRFQAQTMAHMSGIPMAPIPGAGASGKMHGPELPGNKGLEALYYSQQPKRNDKGQFVTNESRLLAARNKLANEYLVANGQIAKDADKTAARQQISKNTTKSISENMHGAALAGGVMAASMVTMSVTSNKTAHNIAQFALIGSIAVPAAKGLVVALKAGSIAAAKQATAAWASTAASRANAAALGGAAGKMGVLRGVTAGTAAAMNSMMGPIGWITLAITAAGLGIAKWLKHEQAITKEKEAQARSVMQQNNLANESLNISQRAQKRISISGGVTGSGSTTVENVADDINSTKSGKALIGRVKGSGDAEQATIATQKYVQVLNSVGGTAGKAQKYVEAMFRAAGDGAIEAKMKAQNAFNSIGMTADTTEISKLWGDLGAESAKSFGAQAAERGTGIGKSIADAIANGADAPDVLNNFGDSLDTKWNDVLTSMSSSAQSTFASVGVDTGAEFKSLSDEWTKLVDQGLDPLPMIMDKFHVGQGKAVELSRALADTSEKTRASMVGLQDVERGTVQELAKQLGLSDKQIAGIKTMTQLRATYNFQLLSASKKNAQALYQEEVARRGLLNGSEMQNRAEMNKNNAVKLGLAQQAAAASGLRVVNNLSEQEVILANAAAEGINQGAQHADKLKKNLSGVPRYLNIAVNFSGEQMGNIYKSGMEGVMNDMADAASSAFDNRMNSSLDATKKTWDNRINAAQEAAQKASDSLDKRFERASNQLDNRWERTNNNFEKRWTRRKDSVTNYYDKRIKAVEAGITAEEKAEKTRQAIFDAEKTRMQRLSDMQNKTIDFNVALRTGQMDEAAKIKNDMEAQANDWMLSDAQGASQSQSDKKVEALGTRKDELDAARERALKALDDREADEKRSLEKREKREKASLQRREEREKASLERRTKADQDALALQAANANAAAASRWQREKASFDQRLMLFKSYIGRDQKDLERWMKEVGFSYDDFGGKVKTKGAAWSAEWQRSLVLHMRAAGAQMASDNMWASLGARSALQTLKGMGFANMSQFRNFILNGKIPDSFGKNLNTTRKNSSGKAPGTGQAAVSAGPHSAQAVHSGGEIGKTNNRMGVARNLKGVHPNEQMILAQKGEYLLNKDVVARNRPLIDSINNGTIDKSSHNIGHGVGGGPIGMGGLAAAMISKGLAAGTGKVMEKMQQKKQSELAAAAAVSGMFTAGGKGQYGDRAFSAEQISNAAIIANVGSGMGMSKRDIEIGIMTAITESGLVNIHGGDRDSQGLFQQRPSQGWGTVAQVTNPRYAAGKFFSTLKGVKNRGGMDPWLAAQAVQRSAYSDGSNYRQYWDNALAIYSSGLKASAGGNFTPAKGGSGGWHRPSVPGKGWANSHDYRNGLRSPVYAYNDGRIIESRAIRSGGSGEGSGAYPRGYSSYGVTVVVQGKDGNKVRAAHMWPGTNAPVGPVKGGALIGLSAATGNATGPHTHFEVNGAEIAREWFQSHGIGLSSGGVTTKDGLANIHKAEAVISPERTKQLYDSLDHFGNVMNASAKNIGGGVGGASTAGGDYGNMNPGYSGISGANVAYGGAPSAVGSLSGNSSANPGISLPADSGNASTVRSAAFNTYVGANTTKTISDLSKIMQRANIMALSEINKKPGLGSMLAKRGWGLYSGGHETAVAWNRNKYNALKLSTMGINPNHYGKAGLMHRYAAYGLFEDKNTHRQFWQASAHTVPARSPGHTSGTIAQRSAIQREQSDNLEKLYRQLKGTGKPVIFGGDINRYVSAGIGGKIHGAGNNTYQIFSNMKSSGSSVLSQKGFYSDGPAVFGNYNLPQLKKGGSVRFDNTLANLHRDEHVLTAGLSKEFEQGVKNFASGPNVGYTINVDATGTGVNADDIVRKTMQAIDRRENRKARPRA